MRASSIKPTSRRPCWMRGSIEAEGTEARRHSGTKGGRRLRRQQGSRGGRGVPTARLSEANGLHSDEVGIERRESKIESRAEDGEDIADERQSLARLSAVHFLLTTLCFLHRAGVEATRHGGQAEVTDTPSFLWVPRLHHRPNEKTKKKFILEPALKVSRATRNRSTAHVAGSPICVPTGGLRWLASGGSLRAGPAVSGS